MIIDKLFPVNVGIVDNPNHSELLYLEKYIYQLSKKIKKGGNNWISNKTYNTSETHNVFKDNKFNPLVNWVNEQIIKYCKLLDYNGELNATTAWFNIYKKYDYQEYHNHMGGSLVAVYFFKSKEGSSTFNIKKPYERDSKEFATGDHTTFDSKEGRLLIFNSSIKHCVSQHLGKENRISFSFNYKRND